MNRELKGNILVVDDNPANLRLLSNMLTEQGYKVRSVINGQMALTATRAAAPDLILLDINMPDMNGYEVCRTLKTDEATQDIPVIFISALDEIDDKIKAFAIGGVDYVTKPFQFEEVLARVETHLALRDLQRQLEQQLAEVQARNEELDAFAHTVAHDLKNPLTALIGYSTMLESRYQRMSSDKLAHGLSVVTKSGRRMHNIIEELLLMSRVRKTEEIELEEIDLAAAVVEAQERLVDMIEEYTPEIVVAESWPQVMGRQTWVAEVWTNYLSNAIKYGGRPPYVELGADAEDGSVRLWVRDNGEGLTPEEQARLFAPFERLHHVRAEGHGLGLSIVRRIVEKLGGEVGVESVPGEGSTFFFTLPAG